MISNTNQLIVIDYYYWLLLIIDYHWMISPGDFTTLLILSIFRLLLFISGKPGHKDDSFWRRQKWKLLPLPRVSMNQQMICCQYGGCCYESPVDVFGVIWFVFLHIFKLKRVFSWVEDTCVMSNKLSSKPSKKDRPRSTGKIIFTPQSLRWRLLLRSVLSSEVKISCDKFKLRLKSDLSRIYSLKKKPN